MNLVNLSLLMRLLHEKFVQLTKVVVHSCDLCMYTSYPINLNHTNFFLYTPLYDALFHSVLLIANLINRSTNLVYVFYSAAYPLATESKNSLE